MTEVQKGYYHIPVQPADITRVAIMTSSVGLYEILRMPFGLRNAGNSFQGVMDCVLVSLDFFSLVSGRHYRG